MYKLQLDGLRSTYILMIQFKRMFFHLEFYVFTKLNVIN